MKHIIWKILYQGEICIGIRSDFIGRLYGAGTNDYGATLNKHCPLLKVSKSVVKFGQIRMGLDREKALPHLLTKSALRSEHEDDSGFVRRFNVHSDIQLQASCPIEFKSTLC